MAEIIGEEEIGDDDVFSVEEPASQIGADLFGEEPKEKNNKYLFIKVAFLPGVFSTIIVISIIISIIIIIITIIFIIIIIIVIIIVL